MGLEFGKWLMDVAKYMLTALLLASFFGDMNTPGMVAIAILIMMVILGLGLWFVHFNSPDDKNVTIYVSIHPLNRLYLKAIQEMLKIKNDWI